MYEYKFVTIKVSTWTWKPKEDYKKVIEQHAKHGWRLSQIVAREQNRDIEIVFERLV